MICMLRLLKPNFLVVPADKAFATELAHLFQSIVDGATIEPLLKASMVSYACSSLVEH